MELTTKRLRLRLWRDEDLPAFAALNSDPRVMQYMPKLLDRAESDAFAERIKENFARTGFGLWAVEVTGTADFIGFTGLSVPRFEARFTPCVEIGWRLAFDYWGHGGMTHFPEDDFHHPLLPEGHPLRYHVLYRLDRPVL